MRLEKRFVGLSYRAQSEESLTQTSEGVTAMVRGPAPWEGRRRMKIKSRWMCEEVIKSADDRLFTLMS